MNVVKAIALSLLMLISAAVYAQNPTKDQQVATIHTQLQAASDKRDALRNEAAPQVAAVTALNEEINQFNAAKARHNSQVEEFETRVAAQKEAIDQHNNNRCVSYNGRSQDCAAYNAEEARLNANSASLTNEGNNLDAAKYQLDEQQKELQARTDKWNTWRAGFDTRWNANEAEIDRLIKLLAAVQKENISCTDALHDPALSDEQVKEACSHLFDGNGTKTPLTNQGTGSKMK